MRNEVHTRCEGYWQQRSRVLTRGHILRALKHLQHILLCMRGSALIKPLEFGHNVRNVAGCLLSHGLILIDVDVPRHQNL